LGLFSKSQ